VTLSRTARRAALGVFVVVFVAGAAYLWQTGAVTPTTVARRIATLGPAAPLLFVGAMIGGAFVGLPGIAFVVGGRLAFGPYVGVLVGFGGGMLAVTLPFVLARRVRGAGRDPWRPRHPWLVRVFDTIETHPFRAIVALRLVLWFNPPLSYTLAFMTVSTRTYVTACAVALGPVVAIAMVATSWFL
jgi:uncharacterized membrane protein YdjX (TVP38/TMEM64 family)